MQKLDFKSIAIISLTLFSMFFGAGNFIFPPYIGSKTILPNSKKELTNKQEQLRT